MSANVVALLYLAAGVLFILALQGLSSPVSSRQGNIFGMLGMTIATQVNVAFINRLMAEIRQAIDDGTYLSYKADFLGRYYAGSAK